MLENAGLIVQRAEGTRRPHRLAAEGIAEIDRWLATLRQALEADYNRLDGVLAAVDSNQQREKP